MKLRNRMIPDRPRIAEPTAVEVQEDVSSQSSTAPQVGSPANTRTRSVSASDSQQQQPLPSIPEIDTSSQRGQHAQYYRLDLHEDFVLYSQSDTDDGIVEEPGSSADAFLSPPIHPRFYRGLVPRPDTQPTPATGSSSTSTQAMSPGQQVMTPQRQQPPMHIQLPTPSQTDSMMPHFENEEDGPWSSTSPIKAEDRQIALSNEIPDILEYPKDRQWNDKMQDALNDIEKRPEGLENPEEEGRKGRKRKRKGKNSASAPASKRTRKDDRHRRGKDPDRSGGQGGEQTVAAS